MRKNDHYDKANDKNKIDISANTNKLKSEMILKNNYEVDFKQNKYMKTALAGSVSRTSGSSCGAGGAGRNTGPIRPGAYGLPAPRFVEPCWPVLYAVSPIPSPVPSEPDPCRIGNPEAISTADRAA